MPHLKISAAQWEQIWPNAPDEVIRAFATKQDVLIKAGILSTRNRLAFFCANIEHECGGFTIKNLTENINYTAARMAQVWPNRFSSAAAVQAKYGTGPGWQKRAFDDIYGNRMGNRPGTSDGSTYIGRGGPQWTGRDGYEALQRITGISAVADPSLACRFDLQPEVCAAFWTWKNLNAYADRNDFTGAVKVWNGGTNGMADRRSRMSGNDPIISRLTLTADMTDVVNEIEEPAIPKAEPAATGVFWIQESLNKLGAEPRLTPDGKIGPSTTAAIRVFQAEHNLVVDGKIGPQTLAVMDTALAQLASPTIVVPKIELPPPGAQPRADLAPTFWGRVFDLFRPRGT